MEAAEVVRLSSDTAMIRSLFMSTVQGTDGHGSEDMLIVKVVEGEMLILERLNPTRLFTTSAVPTMVTDPWVRVILKGMSMKWSNS
jgi:hypothetical protein